MITVTVSEFWCGFAAGFVVAMGLLLALGTWWSRKKGLTGG
ncbi:MAG: hypothetical protein PHZ19_12190 [Candidatus Thermoplasmatota archaeon]|nr:hypothetical protein [Candidatus Thermoplasmatota archaeon]